jgi:hypothetical protein
MRTIGGGEVFSLPKIERRRVSQLLNGSDLQHLFLKSGFGGSR